MYVKMKRLIVPGDLCTLNQTVYYESVDPMAAKKGVIFKPTIITVIAINITLPAHFRCGICDFIVLCDAGVIRIPYGIRSITVSNPQHDGFVMSVIA